MTIPRDATGGPKEGSGHIQKVQHLQKQLEAKLAVTALVLVVFGASMMGLISDFTEEIFATIAQTGSGSIQ